MIDCQNLVILILQPTVIDLTGLLEVFISELSFLDMWIEQRNIAQKCDASLPTAELKNKNSD